MPSVRRASSPTKDKVTYEGNPVGAPDCERTLMKKRVLEIYGTFSGLHVQTLFPTPR